MPKIPWWKWACVDFAPPASQKPPNKAIVIGRFSPKAAQLSV